MGEFESTAFSYTERPVGFRPGSSLIHVTWIVPSFKWHFLNQTQPNLLCQLHYLPLTERVSRLVGNVNFSILCQHVICITQETPNQRPVKSENKNKKNKNKNTKNNNDNMIPTCFPVQYSDKCLAIIINFFKTLKTKEKIK